MTDALKRHWPEYLMEAVCLGLFMISAFTFGAILEYPGSALHQAIPYSVLRRFVMGIAMGSTAILIIYSPWGKQSGAHINPSTTLTFWRLGKVGKWDALFYIVAHFVGSTTGALLASTVLSARKGLGGRSLHEPVYQEVSLSVSTSKMQGHYPSIVFSLHPTDLLVVDHHPFTTQPRRQ
jgi:hypothetical protein